MKPGTNEHIVSSGLHEEEFAFLEAQQSRILEHSPEAFLLERTNGILTLKSDETSFFIDFSSGKTGYRILKGGEGKKSPLARACGIHRHGESTIIDATAGLGADSFLLAQTGCTLTLFERSPILYLLLQDALKRARLLPALKDAADRMTLFFGDSIELLKQQAEAPDVCYLDPMYTPRTKKALVKQDLRIVRSLVGDDTDASLLLDAALSVAKRQLVVKRMRDNPPLADRKPHHVVKGRTIRYDVYMTK